MRKLYLGTASDNRRGFSIIYIPLILLLLIGFVAMAVDTGRIRLSKAQLQGAADAAAHAGARSLAGPGFNGGLGIAFAEQRADTTAKANVVADGNVVFDKTADLEWGIWDSNARTFTQLINDPGTEADERGRANACRAFARALEARGSSVSLLITPHVTTFNRGGGAAGLSVRSNLQTEAIAMVGGGPRVNASFVGLNGINGNGTSLVVGSMASDGSINLGGTDVIGDARPGLPPATLTYGPSGTVTGWQANLDYLLAPSYPAWTIQDKNNDNAEALPAPVGSGKNKTYTLPGSNNASNPKVYYGSFDSNNNNAKIVCDGYVRVYTDTAVNFQGCAVENVQTPLIAAKFVLRVIGAVSVTIGGTPTTYMHLSAPQSDITLNGTPNFSGSIVGKTITMKGTNSLTGDTSGTDTTAYIIKLVR